MTPTEQDLQLATFLSNFNIFFCDLNAANIIIMMIVMMTMPMIITILIMSFQPKRGCWLLMTGLFICLYRRWNQRVRRPQQLQLLVHDIQLVLLTKIVGICMKHSRFFANIWRHFGNGVYTITVQQGSHRPMSTILRRTDCDHRQRSSAALL